jgi:hypothetical protein
MKYLLLFVVSALCFSVCLNESNAQISVFQDRNILLAQTSTELKAIMEAFFYAKRDPYINSSNLIQEGYFYNTSLNISVLNQVNHFDPNKLNFSPTENGFDIDGHEAFQITIFFHYDAKLSLRSPTAGTGSFKVKSILNIDYWIKDQFNRTNCKEKRGHQPKLGC